MAVAGDCFKFLVPSATTFTLNLLGGKWRRRRTPAPGDLAVVLITKPTSGINGPAGWVMLPHAEGGGHGFWKVLSPADIGPDITFTSGSDALEWESNAWVIDGGTYTLPVEPDAYGSSSTRS
jgi:hypothetical protein